MIMVAPVTGRVCFNPDDRRADGSMRKLTRPTYVRPSAYWTRRSMDGGCKIVDDPASKPAESRE